MQGERKPERARESERREETEGMSGAQQRPCMSLAEPPPGGSRALHLQGQFQGRPVDVGPPAPRVGRRRRSPAKHRHAGAIS